MIPLYTEQEFKNSKSRQSLPLQCKKCHNIFYKPKNEIQKSIKQTCKSGITLDFCSNNCKHQSKITFIQTTCKNCNKIFNRPNNQIIKYKNHFCSKSCNAKYNNAHKIKGTRCSKLEKWIQNQLPLKYPSLEFHFNKTNAINAELDIYIPSLKLAFELNGIFHYEPIFGQEKLALIQTNDQRKYQACIEKGIELCIIDSSKESYFKEQKCQKYLDIICNIVNLKLSKNLPNF